MKLRTKIIHAVSEAIERASREGKSPREIRLAADEAKRQELDAYLKRLARKKHASSAR